MRRTKKRSESGKDAVRKSAEEQQLTLLATPHIHVHDIQYGEDQDVRDHSRALYMASWPTITTSMWSASRSSSRMKTL